MIQLVIEMRCTDSVLMSFTAAIGFLVFTAQTLPIFTHDWVELTEPRPMNLTDENGVFLVKNYAYQTYIIASMIAICMWDFSVSQLIDYNQISRRRRFIMD